MCVLDRNLPKKLIIHLLCWIPSAKPLSPELKVCNDCLVRTVAFILPIFFFFFFFFFFAVFGFGLYHEVCRCVYLRGFSYFQIEEDCLCITRDCSHRYGQLYRQSSLKLWRRRSKPKPGSFWFSIFLFFYYYYYYFFFFFIPIEIVYFTIIHMDSLIFSLSHSVSVSIYCSLAPDFNSL